MHTSTVFQKASHSCVVLTSNRAYIGYAEFVAWQIRRQGLSDLPIFIASADAEQHDLQKNVATILPIKVDDFISNLPQNARLKHYTYWRIPAITTLAEQFDRVLYLDTDMLITGGNLRRLFDIDLEGAPIAAVRDVHQSVRPQRVAREFLAMGLPNSPYFNAGMLLIDGPAFVRDKRTAQIEHIARTHPLVLTAHDQSLLNIAFYNNWLELSPVWNWQFSYRNSLLTPYLDLEVLHLAGANKPWDDPKHNLPALARHSYAVYSGITDSPTLSKLSPSCRDIIKHWRYYKRYQNWLQRFPDRYRGILAEPFDR